MSVVTSSARHSLIERIIEWLISGGRWLLAPIYVGLAAALVVRRRRPPGAPKRGWFAWAWKRRPAPRKSGVAE
jgi:hypothetical protein